jgi:hypothetical protein
LLDLKIFFFPRPDLELSPFPEGFMESCVMWSKFGAFQIPPSHARLQDKANGFESYSMICEGSSGRSRRTALPRNIQDDILYKFQHDFIFTKKKF